MGRFVTVLSQRLSNKRRVFIMFYVNYVGSDVSSVVDTKDLVEEFYTNAQIKEFRKSVL